MAEAEERKHTRLFFLCGAACSMLSAFAGAGSGFLLGLLLYSVKLFSDPMFIWKSWHFLYSTSSLGFFSGTAGGLFFSLLFFRENIGRFALLRFFLFSLLSLAAASTIFGLAVHHCMNTLIAGYLIGLFFLISFIPWFLVSLLGLVLRVRIIRG